MTETGVKADDPRIVGAQGRPAVRVLVVDDSGFFRRRVCEILNDDPNIEVIGNACNGLEAVEQTARLHPDVITMDIEMPVLDGISAVRRIMASHPTPVLMLSSLTYEGARATLDALDAGALDFLPKRLEDIARNREDANRVLRARVHTLGCRRLRVHTVVSAPAPVRTRRAVSAARRPQAVVIGTSTGGPAALQRLLPALREGYPFPLLLVQHMPASFTGAFAERLNQLCTIRVKEAEDGEPVLPATAYLAPGGRQMLAERRAGGVHLRITDSRPEVTYRPSVDVCFASAARVWPGGVLGIVLTGMGSDGREGARLLKAGGSQVWVQDEPSCVVYGMPQAVVGAGLADWILPLDEIGLGLARQI
jgi:two-component system chemotaxis response regulator CheB